MTHGRLWSADHMIMINIMWLHFDQSAKQLIVGHTTNVLVRCQVLTLQSECPQTKTWWISLITQPSSTAPASVVIVLKLSEVLSGTRLPALRTKNTSPMSVCSIRDMMTRLSMHENMTALGCKASNTHIHISLIDCRILFRQLKSSRYK